jgi:lipopolysaccharide/colanic/teichoic acid biosynthesis glycosyltransferase
MMNMALDESYIHPITRIGKRTLDVTCALIGLALTLPFYPIIILAIKLDSPGPAFFRQLRVGRCWPHMTELFMMIKFRTMRTDAEAKTGAVWASKNDPRITRLGNFLRKTRIDELPQLFNVLAGEMSLIGPRPERPGIFRKLENAIPFYSERTYGVAPGITGLAQINLGYDETIEDVRAKVGYDHAYALALSHPYTWLRADLHIMALTVGVMFGRRGQ